LSISTVNDLEKKGQTETTTTGWEKLKDYVTGKGYDRYLQISGMPEPKKL